MVKLITNWLLGTVALVVAAYLLPGVHIRDLTAALVTALVLGIINAVLKPILLLLTLPINVLTLGLFTLVINALLILLASTVVSGFSVDNFWWALLLGLVLSLINSFFHKISPS